MAYDPNRLMGLDALSPTVGAYKQFVERQNKVDDNNVVPFLVSRGEPQLAGLIAKKMRVENAAKSQQQLAQQPPAAPPTVAQQYDMAAAQQAQQEQMARHAQMMQQAQMAQGLGGMPAPVMDRANFAGGGIVAFNDGGDVRHFDGLSGSQVSGGLFSIYNPSAGAQIKEAAYRALIDSVQKDLAAGKISQLDAEKQLQQAYASMRDAQRLPLTGDFSKDMGLGDFSSAMGITPPSDASAAPAAPAAVAPAAPKPSPVKPPVATTKPVTPAATKADKSDTDFMTLIGDMPDLEKMRQAEDAAQKAGGYGKYSKALSDEEAFIKQQQENYGADKKEAQKNFFVMLGASLLGNRSPHFATALGEALTQNYAAYSKELRGLKSANEELEQKKNDLAFKREQALQTTNSKVLQEYATLKKDYIDNVRSYQNRQDTLAANLQVHEDTIAQRAETARETAAYHNLLAQTSGGIDVQVYRDLLSKGNTPEEAYKIIQTGKASSRPTSNASAVSAARARQQGALSQIKTYQYDPTPAGKAALARAQQEYMQASADLARLGGGSGTSSAATIPSESSGAGDVSSMSNEELMKALGGI